MNKFNTLFGQILALVKRSDFEKLVKQEKADRNFKHFSAWKQFVVMLFAQFSGQNGLRSIENSFNAQRNTFYHLGITDREIKRTTLAYANEHRSSEFFEKLFYQLLEKVPRNNQKKCAFKNPFYAVDATVIGLCMNTFPWAKFRTTKAGIKLNTKLDLRTNIPSVVTISNAQNHENATLGEMRLKENDIVVFDRGYTNYHQYASFCNTNIWFVSPLKANADYEVLNEIRVTDKKIVCDEVIQMTGFAAVKNDLPLLRNIVVYDEENKRKLSLLTNIMDAEACDVAQMYKQRWQIELFFKAIKQNLKIKTFYGTSENAVKTQIWIALISFLLFRILRSKASAGIHNFTHFMSEFAVVLFQRRDLYLWFKRKPDYSPPPVTRDSKQILLF